MNADSGFHTVTVMTRRPGTILIPTRELSPMRRLIDAIARDLMITCTREGKLDWRRVERCLTGIAEDARRGARISHKAVRARIAPR